MSDILDYFTAYGTIKIGGIMSEFYMRVDEHTPEMIKALIKYSPFKQRYFADELGMSPSNLSSYLGGKKKMSHQLAMDLIGLIGFDPDHPYLLISNKKFTNK